MLLFEGCWGADNSFFITADKIAKLLLPTLNEQSSTLLTMVIQWSRRKIMVIKVYHGVISSGIRFSWTRLLALSLGDAIHNFK